MVDNIKIIGIGGVGCNILGRMTNNEKLPFLVLDTNMCPFIYLTCNKILCGKKVCKGLGSGGNIDLGYSSAEESLKDKMGLFYDNEVNVFVLGLGGGTGSGISKFILKQLSEIKKDKKVKNKYNIVICTYPSNIEKSRVEKARKTLEAINSLSDLIILVKLEDLMANTRNKEIPQLFESVNFQIGGLILTILDMSNNDFINHIEEYSKKNKIIEVKNYENFTNCFFNKIEVPKNLFKKDIYSIRERISSKQLKSAQKYLGDAKKILFVGCSTGEEIIDFQKLSNKDIECFGIDSDKWTVERANQRKYLFPTRVFITNALNKNFLEKVKDETNNEKFDVVICRDLLIYYTNNDEALKTIVENLSKLVNKFLVLGIHDPLVFSIQNNKVKIGENIFEVIDFDNRIFKKEEREVNLYFISSIFFRLITCFCS